VLWDPKPEMFAEMNRQTAGSLRWFASGTDYFRSLSTLTWPPPLMDSGLLLCASSAPDKNGFVAFDRPREAFEAPAVKGMLWACWGSLGVVNTHMTFEYADSGVQRRMQQRRLATLVGQLLGLCGKHGDGKSDEAAAIGYSGSPCRAVLLFGDFNHTLPEQTRDDGKGSPPTHDKPLNRYVGPWLPPNASLSGLLATLSLDGRATVTRLSGDTPTNEDGTVDHIFVVTPSEPSTNTGCDYTFATEECGVLEDENAEIADHLQLRAVLRRTPRAA
jgi:endonuclease/exonuclease/phosphatase family metal-dependent hydrolase